MALRIEDVPFTVPLPAELRQPPAFEPLGMRPDVLAELRRRSESARRYLVAVKDWAGKLDAIVQRSIEILSRDTILQAEIVSVSLAEMELNSEQNVGEMISSHEQWRRTVVELMEPSERAAWLGYLDPFIEVMKIKRSTPRDLRMRLYNEIQGALPGYYKLPFEKFAPDLYLNSRAGEFFSIFMSIETNLKCEMGNEIVRDEVLPVVTVRVPSGISRPHRVYGQAEANAMQKLAHMAPALAGRVAVRYEKAADAS